MTEARAFLEAIRAGRHADALVLADWLMERGHEAAAKWLRTRYRRYAGRVQKHRQALEAWQWEEQARLDRVRAAVEGVGGRFAGSVTVDSTLIADEGGLLAAYVARLLDEVARAERAAQRQAQQKEAKAGGKKPAAEK
jgi:uncharacterized protein (TIGR02996 family)